jgi:hypothetical protein
MIKATAKLRFIHHLCYRRRTIIGLFELARSLTRLPYRLLQASAAKKAICSPLSILGRL